MAQLNLRGLSEGLVRRLKVEAAGLNRSLRDHCAILLGDQGEMEREEVVMKPVVPTGPVLGPRERVVGEKKLTAGRGSHDPKACRIYGCLQCKDGKK